MLKRTVLRAGGNLRIQQQKRYRLKFMHRSNIWEVPTFVGMTGLLGKQHCAKVGVTALWSIVIF